MLLPALTAGYAIPRADFDAIVHSVFRSALNLRVTGQDLLLTLLVAGEADLPQALRLDTPDGFSFETFRPGDRVSCRRLANAAPASNRRLVVEFAHARRWQCDLPGLRADLRHPGTTEAWQRAWRYLNERQARQGAEIAAAALLADDPAQPAVCRRLGEAARALMDAARHSQVDASSFSPPPSSFLKSLIGLGGGLTPSGDDFLVGYLGGLWCTVQDSEARQVFLAKLRQAVNEHAGQTNDISRAYLAHAAQGQISSRLEALAGAICRAEPAEHLLPCAEAAMQSGHTSGMDAVTGLLFGLAAWDFPQRAFSQFA